MTIPTIKSSTTIPTETTPKRTDPWTYLPKEAPIAKIISILGKLGREKSKERASYRSMQNLVAFAGNCSSDIYYHQAIERIHQILKSLPTYQLQQAIGHLESKKNTLSTKKAADKMVSKGNCEKKESSKKATPASLQNKLVDLIGKLNAPEKIESLSNEPSNKSTKELVEWSFHLIKAFVEKTYVTTGKRNAKLITLLPNILSGWSYILQESFFNSHEQDFSKTFFSDLQKQFIKHLRVQTLPCIRNAEYLKELDSWSRKLLENPESLVKNDESNEIFLEFYLNEMLRQFGVSSSNETSAKKLLERIQNKTPLTLEDKKALFEKCYRPLFENVSKSFGHSAVQYMEVAQLPAFFTWDYLTTLSKKIPLGIYSTWTERLRGEISEKYLFPALVKIRQIPSDFENFSLKEVKCKIIQAETSEDLRKARALLGEEKTAVDLLEGFSKDYPNLNLSIHNTKKAVEDFFHTNILDLIKVLKNTYMPLDFLYLSYKLINSPLIRHLKQIAEGKKAFLNKEQTPTKNYHKYIGTYKKLVEPLDFLRQVHNLGAETLNDLDPNVLIKTEPNAPRRKALFDCTYLVKSWENLDKALSQKPEEKKHER